MRFTPSMDKNNERSTKCMFSVRIFSKSNPEDEWVKCSNYQKNGHTKLAVQKTGKQAHGCDFCIKM
jgi:hypothetical protein